ADDGFVGAAVRRSPERGDAGGDRGIRIRARAARHAYRGRGAVLLVIGVQDEEQVQCFRGDFVDVVRLGRYREEHVQQVLAVVEVVARVDERLAGAELEGGGGDRRQLGDDAVRED